MRPSGRSVAFSLAFLAIQSPAAAQDTLARWQVAPHPLLTIGSAGHRGTGFLRVGAVLRLPGGGVAVLNGATSEIRIFDPSGRYLRAMGRAGANPGEFRSPELLGRTGDTLFVADRINARITSFLENGALVSTISVTARDDAGRLNVAGRLEDGRWAVRSGSGPTLVGPQRTYRDTSRIGAIAPDGSGPVTWLGELPGPTWFVYNPGNGPHGDVAAAAPLAPTSIVLAWGNEILVGNTGDNVLGAYSENRATVLRLITLPLPALPLTDARIAEERQRALARNPGERARPYLTALYSRAVMGPSLPVFSQLVPAADGSLWVHQGPSATEKPATWLILDRGGKPRARIETPAGLRITEVGTGYVLGVHTDATGVETVRQYQYTERR